MKVLVAHSRYRSVAPSGENRVVDAETAALTERGVQVIRFERRSDDIETWSPLRRAALPARVLWNGEVSADLARVLRRERPDVVHVHNTFPLLSPSVLYACRDEGVPVVATVHNYKLLCLSGDFFSAGSVCHRCQSGVPVPGLVRGCYRGSRLASLPVATATIAHRRAWRELVSAYVFISDAQRRLMDGLHLDARRVFVKHNLARPALRVGTPSQRRHAVAYVGRLDAAKGVPLLMRAWDEFRARRGDDGLRLVLAGRGPLEGQVDRWAADRPSVESAGLLGAQECTRLMADCRAVVLPSAWEETFGLVVLEAMAVGTPALAAGHGSLPELVTDHVDGRLFPAGDAGRLADLLVELDDDPAAFGPLGRAARRTLARRHDPARNTDMLLAVYEFARDHPVRGVL
jgi:glycosyltransferase involved in cell wall biosynthesis